MSLTFDASLTNKSVDYFLKTNRQTKP